MRGEEHHGTRSFSFIANTLGRDEGLNEYFCLVITRQVLGNRRQHPRTLPAIFNRFRGGKCVVDLL
jgi:hypothetical protein